MGVTEVIGSTPSTSTRGELFDKGQNGVELAAQILDLIVGNRDTRQMRDTADGGGVDGHECWPNGQLRRETPAVSVPPAIAEAGIPANRAAAAAMLALRAAVA